MNWTGARRALDLALVCIALVILWQSFSWLIGAETLPGPWQTVQNLIVLMGQGRFQRDLAATSQAYAIALVLAMVGGVTLGVLCGGWRSIGAEVEPVLLALIATPKVMFYPIILLFFGLGDAAKIFFGLLHGLPTVVIMTANALRTLRPIYRKAALTLRLSKHRYALYVMMPAVFPELVASFRVCFALTLLGVLVGEMFASTKGLGHLLFASIGTNDQPTIMAITLLLFVFAGLGSSVLLAASQRMKNHTPMT
jgi:NitT/TauT family transport system permease protein